MGENVKNDQTLEVLINQACIEGKEAAGKELFTCDYKSGSGFYDLFCDAFVDQSSRLSSLPVDTPMYLMGRVAFAKGFSVEAKPESETYAGRWFSGWLAEKDRSQLKT